MAEQTRPKPEPAPPQEPDHCQSSTLPASRLEGVLRAASRVSIIATDRDGIIQVFNSGAEHMLGYTAKELIGRKTPAVFHLASETEDYARELTERLGRPVRGHESLVAQVVAGGPEAYDAREWTYVRKDGRHVPVHLTITCLYTPAGEREGILGVAVDLTEQKALEASLRQAQASVDNAQDMILWAAAEDGRFAYANDAVTRYLGYSRAELLAMSAFELNPIMQTPEDWQGMVRELRSQGRKAIQFAFRRKDGGSLPVECNSTLIRHEGRDYVMGVVRDLSERLNLEASLRQAQASVDNAQDMIFWAAAEDGRYTYVNEAATRHLGYSREELLAMSVVDLNPVRTPENWRETVRLLRAQKRHVWRGEFRRKDGSLLPVEFNASLISHEGRDYVLGVVRDLSERLALEADLRQAQVSVDNAQDMILWGDVETARYAYANDAVTRHLGYSRAELLAMSAFDLNPGSTWEGWRAMVRRLRSQGRMVLRGQFLRKDGGLLPVEYNISLIRHEGRDYILGVVRDISERLALEASLRQAQLSVDRAGDMILWLNVSDARIRYVNEAACRALGYSREELLAMQTFNISPRRTPENWRAACDLVRAAGQATYETLFRTRDGRNLPVEVNGSLVEHQGQEFLLAIIRDLSERKQAEERLQGELLLNRSLARVARALISAEPDLAAISRTLLEGAREVTGSRYGNVSVIDQDTGDLVPHTMTSMPPGEQCPVLDRPAVLRPGPDGTYPGLWGRGLNTGQGFFDNDRAANPLARPLPQGHAPVRQFLTVPAVAKGRVVGQIGLANPDRDYDAADLAAAEALADLFALGVEQVLSRRALLEAKEAAEASSRAKGEFLANMTHEVRTPLNGVLGMLQVLQSTALDQEQQESVRVALESAERLHLLLTNILEFARLDSAPGALPECLTFPPTDLLHALAAIMAPRAQAKGLDFSVAAEPGLPEFIRSDPAALRQCLGHLLDNAVKFTAAGMVRLGAGPAQGQDGRPRVAFRVEDTGIGIPADQDEAVFEAFAQADASFTRTYGGAGLGLAIARRLARRLGGDITAQNRPGGGTVMTLTILADNSPRAAS